MHDTRRWRLVSYDIRDPKRWRKVFKVVKGYGESVQYSLFRCRLDDRQTAKLRSELAKVLAAEDSLLVVDLCGTCAANVVSKNHVEGWTIATPTFVLVGDDQASAHVKSKKE